MMHPKYRDLWETAGYPRTIGSAAVVKPPSPRFRRVYHLCSAEYGISNIGLGHLKIARFSDLNDPFELIALNLGERESRQVVRDFKNAYDAKTGLLCFSEDWTNPVIWSHYASKHKGICLGFDVKKADIRKVDYSEKRILRKLKGENPFDGIKNNLRDKLMNTKYEHWSYESEYRMFIPLNNKIKKGNLYFKNFDENFVLREVILGPLCQLRLKDVRALVDSRYEAVTTFKSRLAYKFFKVVPYALTVP